MCSCFSALAQLCGVFIIAVLTFILLNLSCVISGSLDFFFSTLYRYVPACLHAWKFFYCMLYILDFMCCMLDFVLFRLEELQLD